MQVVYKKKSVCKVSAYIVEKIDSIIILFGDFIDHMFTTLPRHLVLYYFIIMCLGLSENVVNYLLNHSFYLVQIPIVISSDMPWNFQ